MGAAVFLPTAAPPRSARREEESARKGNWTASTTKGKRCMSGGRRRPERRRPRTPNHLFKHRRLIDEAQRLLEQRPSEAATRRSLSTKLCRPAIAPGLDPDASRDGKTEDSTEKEGQSRQKKVAKLRRHGRYRRRRSTTNHPIRVSSAARMSQPSKWRISASNSLRLLNFRSSTAPTKPHTHSLASSLLGPPLCVHTLVGFFYS